MECISLIMYEISVSDGAGFAEASPVIYAFCNYINVLGDFIGGAAIARVFTV